MSITQTEMPVEMPGEFQSDFDDAKALLNAGRYAAARTAFARLLENAPETLRRDIGDYLEMAAEKLARQIDGLVTNAEEYSQRQPDDLVNQRRLWEKILEIKPDYEIAVQTLATLTRQEQENKIRLELEDIRRDADVAAANSRLTELNRILGRAQNLQDTNKLEHLGAELDETVARITSQRQQARKRLGRASTLAVTGNVPEAYRQAQEYLNMGLSTIIDTIGVLGETGEEVDLSTFLMETRRHFLASLRDLGQQRLAMADEQKKANPGIALRTLNDMLQRLQDDVLTRKDQEELESMVQLVQRSIEEVQERFSWFQKAEELVREAESPGTSPMQSYELLLAAREYYPEYPDIEESLAAARRIAAAVELSVLEDRLVPIQAFVEHVVAQGFDPEYAEEVTTKLEKLAKIRAEAFASKIGLAYFRDVSSQWQDWVKKVYDLQYSLAGFEHHQQRLARHLSHLENLFHQYREQKRPAAVIAARFYIDHVVDTIYQSSPNVQRYRALFDQAQEEVWIGEAQAALQEQPPDYEKAIATLRFIPQIELSPQGLSSWLEAIRGYVAQRLADAKASIKKFDFRNAENILQALQEQIADWSSSFPVVLDLASNVASLLQEAITYRDALRDLGEADYIIHRSDAPPSVDYLLEKALRLPYRSDVALKLKRDAELLRLNQSLYTADYAAYKQRLLAMLYNNPLDDDIRRRYDEVQEQEHKQQQLEEERAQKRRLDDQRWQWNERRRQWTQIWFVISALTALIFLGLSFYSIFVLVNRNIDFAILSPLLAALPIFATKLVYDRFSELYNDRKADEASQPAPPPDAPKNAAGQ